MIISMCIAPQSPRTRVARAWLCVLLCAALSPARGQSAPSPPASAENASAPAAPAADVRAERQVARQLQAQPDLRKVDASVDAGTATLTGEVAAPPHREKAATVAKSVDGVDRVDNRIALDPDVRVRFEAAMSEVKGKLVKLVANLPLLLLALLIVILASWFGGFVARRLRLLSRISKRNPYMDDLLRSIVHGLVLLGGVLLALDLLGWTSLVGAVLGSAGVVGLVLGFAFKDIAENYIAGILLSVRQPFRPGDLVRIDNHEGRVVALTSRVTQLMTVDGNHLQLPNSLVFKSVMLNYTRNPRRRFDFTTNVAVGQSWHDAMETGIAAIAAVDGVLPQPAPSALIKELADGSATLQFFGWIDQTHNDLPKTRSEAMRAVRRTLRDHGIVPPDGVQRIALMRDGKTGIEQGDSVAARDTGVDHTLDHQLADAQRQGDDAPNLLDGRARDADGADAPR